MDAGYLGGSLRRKLADTFTGAGWHCAAGDDVLAVDVHDSCARLFAWDTLALLIRGYVRPAGDSGPLDVEAVAQELRCQYLESNDLAVDGLEGSFSLALLDAAAGRVLLYRNLVGAGFTYYHAGRDGFRFGIQSRAAGRIVGRHATGEPAGPAVVLPLPVHTRVRDAVRRLLPPAAG